MISQKFQMNLFEESDVWTLSREDFLAKLSVLQEKEKVLQILEELSFLILHASHIFCDLSILFLENVKGLLNQNEGATFETILRTLDELGYDVEWQLFNSKYFVPQNSERVFIVGYFRGSGARKFFPLTGEEK